MYVQNVDRRAPRPWRLSERRPWRARWLLAAAGVLALLGAGYAQETAGAGRPPATAEFVTVAPGDTLWAIASRRYPTADPREKVFEIEQLNRLSGPSVEAGQRLKVPDR